jgi:hypothetical protein
MTHSNHQQLLAQKRVVLSSSSSRTRLQPGIYQHLGRQQLRGKRQMQQRRPQQMSQQQASTQPQPQLLLHITTTPANGRGVQQQQVLLQLHMQQQETRRRRRRTVCHPCDSGHRHASARQQRQPVAQTCPRVKVTGSRNCSR